MLPSTQRWVYAAQARWGKIEYNDIAEGIITTGPKCHSTDSLDILEYLAPHLPASLYQASNTAGTPPLHWAILNNHVAVVKHLVEMPESQGGGVALLHVSSRTSTKGLRSVHV